MRIAVRVVLAVLLAAVVINLAGGLAMGVSKSLPADAPKALVSGLLMQTGLLVFSLLAMLILGKGRLTGFGFAMPQQAQWMSVIFAGFGVGLAAAAIISIASTGKSPLDMQFSPLQTVLMIWVYASTCEEVFTRGLIQSFLVPLADRGINVWRRRLSLPVLVSAAIFGLMHLSLLTMGSPILSVLLIVIFAFVLGLMAGYQRERTTSLLPAVLLHSLFNISGSLVGWIVSIL